MNTTTSKSIGESLLQNVEVISEQFDTFGLPKIKINVGPNELLVNLIENVHLFIQQHRKLLNQVKERNSNLKKLEEENLKLKKAVMQYTDEDTHKKNTIIKLEAKLKSNEVTLENASACRKMTEKKLKTLKQSCLTKERTHNNMLSKITLEKDTLAEQAKLNYVTYIPKDDIFKQELDKFKLKENVYKETIQKLERNNSDLICEILNLKDEVINLITGQTTSYTT